MTSITFSPNGQLLASLSSDSTLKLWDVHTRALRDTLNGHSDGTTAISFLPNSQLLMLASLSPSVLI